MMITEIKSDEPISINGILTSVEVEKQKSYNQALENLLSKVKEHHYLLSDKINSTDYGMFTCGIEKVANELKR